MNTPIWFSNLIFWSVQVALLVLAAGFLPRLLQIRQPRVLLTYWRSLLAISLVMPLVQPWHRVQSLGVMTFAPALDGANAAPALIPVISHWHFPSGQIIAEIIGFAILAGIVARLVIFGLGLLKLRQLRRRSSPISTLADPVAVFEEMRALVNARAEFRLSSDVDSPVTFGIASPVILLPERFPSMGAGFQLAIACHELLHVRRHDWAHHLAEEILRAALWFHPAIAWLIVQVRLAREQLVDLEVVRLTNARKIYLEALLAFATAQSFSAVIPAPPFLVERQLAERVAIMLKETRMSRTRLIASLTAIACWLAVAGTLAVWTFPLKAAPGRAQKTPEFGSTQGGSSGAPDEVTSSRSGAEQTGQPVSKIVVADLRIEGDVKDVEAVRARILKGLEGREFDSDSDWLDEIAAVDIRKDFRSRGYFKVLITVSGAQPLDPEKHRMLVKIHVDEGEQYRTGEISFVNDDPARALVIPQEDLRQQIQLRSGDVYDTDQFPTGLAGIARLYGAQGYLDMVVRPEFSIDDKSHLIATKMHVHEGNQYHVARFDVRGLDSKTRDLLEARLRPGSTFDSTLMEELFNQGKTASGENVAFDDVVHLTRNVEARTVDVVLDYSSGAQHKN